MISRSHSHDLALPTISNNRQVKNIYREVSAMHAEIIIVLDDGTIIVVA